MSTKRKTIKNTGKEGVDLCFTHYWGGEIKGPMLQITQGPGGAIALAPAKEDEPGYIQLTGIDAYELVQEVVAWLKDIAETEVIGLNKKIKADERLRNTIFDDAVNLGYYIQDLKMLEIPFRLLSVIKNERPKHV